MNLEELRIKLLAAARTEAPSDQVPEGFERRLMARLRRHRQPLDLWVTWSRALWKGVLASGVAVAVTVALAVLTPWGPASDDLGDELEAVLLADLDSGHDTP